MHFLSMPLLYHIFIKCMRPFKGTTTFTLLPLTLYSAVDDRNLQQAMTWMTTRIKLGFGCAEDVWQVACGKVHDNIPTALYACIFRTKYEKHGIGGTSYLVLIFCTDSWYQSGVWIPIQPYERQASLQEHPSLGDSFDLGRNTCLRERQPGKVIAFPPIKIEWCRSRKFKKRCTVFKWVCCYRAMPTFKW